MLIPRSEPSTIISLLELMTGVALFLEDSEAERARDGESSTCCSVARHSAGSSALMGIAFLEELK